MKKFRMRTKPKEPQRRTFIGHIYPDSYPTLREMLDAIDKLGIDYSDISWREKFYSYYEADTSACFIYRYPESNESFDKQMKDYKERLDKYNKWLKENKENIEEWKKKKEEAKSKREKARLNRLRKEKEKIEKRIKELED